LSPTRLFACLSCGQQFEISRVVADSAMSMTQCPACGGHEVETLGDGSRPAADPPAETPAHVA
jgi:putative FmdB family regulatory protein